MSIVTLISTGVAFVYLNFYWMSIVTLISTGEAFVYLNFYWLVINFVNNVGIFKGCKSNPVES